MTEQRTRKLQAMKKKRQRVRTMRLVLALFAIILFAMAINGIKTLLTKKAIVTISAKDIEILQGEEMPEIQIDTKLEKHEDAILEKNPKYYAGDFLKDLKAGKYYTVSCEADPKVEGKYKIKILIDEDIQAKVDRKWKKHITLIVNDGVVKVKNPIGTWDGDQFKKYDGTYVLNDFVESEAKTYYFNDKGVKVTGWQTINNKTYYFTKDGVMKKKAWKEKKDDGKYYLGKDGAALTGWQTIKKKQYYFDREGRMATGKVRIGLSECEFDEKGKLISKKETSVDPDKPMIALTFDDGPGERTMELLEQLEKYDAHATFFMLGNKISNNKDVIKKMSQIGCEISSHSYDHANFTKLDASGIKKQMDSTDEKIKAVVGEGAALMRPPYGAINDTVSQNVGKPMILWNVDTLDWKTRNTQSTIDTTMNSVKDGDIVLMHDIHSPTIDAALELIPRLEEAGFQLLTVSELADAKGIQLENGGRYAEFKTKTSDPADEN